MTQVAREAYALRSGEYIEHLGSIATVHPADLELVTRWARQVSGPVLDAGCGPGHWTAHLAGVGVDVCGVDGVREFVDHARAAHPGCRFLEADLGALPFGEESTSGVLAWYSLIHHEPEQIGELFAEFARVLRPGGQLLLGFFHGERVVKFDHVVTPAYYWTAESLAERMRVADFEVIETHTRTGPGHRPHGAIVARLSTDPGGDLI